MLTIVSGVRAFTFSGRLSRHGRFARVALSGALAVLACSSEEPEGGGSGGQGGEGGSGGSNTMLFAPDGGPDSGNPFGEQLKPCVEEVVRAETIPTAIYIMFDQSGSMLTRSGDGTRLDQVRAALADFFRDSHTYGIEVGIGYFGYLPIGETSCDPAEYSTPSVELAALPGSADSLIASLNGVEPTGETPTGAAIRGACEYTRAFKQQNPGHFVFNLLVTDGVPEAPVSSKIAPDGGVSDAGGICDPTLDDAVQATAGCAAETPGVDTFVLGVGPSLDNLNQIAAAGNTQSAYLVEGDDVAAQVLEALTAIRGKALLPCEFAVPPAPEGMELDTGKVNVEFTSDDGGKQELFKVSDWTYCGAEGGWYYDPNGTRIVLCEATCNEVEGASNGQVDYILGCSTRVK
jgi:hypothetical protein